MVSVEHKIDGRSREKFWSIFKNSNKPKLIKTSAELKKQVEQHEPQAPKITMGMVKPSAQRIIFLMLYYIMRHLILQVKGHTKDCI